MKKICLDLTEAKAIGDTLCSTPVLRKLYDSYNSKIIVVTDFPELFKNNPLVEKVYQRIKIKNGKTQKINEKIRHRPRRMPLGRALSIIDFTIFGKSPKNLNEKNQFTRSGT